METKSNIELNKNTQKLIFRIRNILRLLGLNSSIRGTVLLNKAIRVILEKKINEDYFIGNEIYMELTKYYKELSFIQIKTYIQYALDHRDINKSKKNFEKIFGFEYDNYYFTSKRFLEEICENLLINNLTTNILEV